MTSHFRLSAVVLLAAAALGFPASTLRAQAPGIVVISQVYGAGGNVGATYRNDYVELHNRGGSPVSLNGLTVQYAAALGTGNLMVGATLSGTLGAGQYHLVSMGGGSNGVPLPTADTVGASLMNATTGKVALVQSTTTLGCNGGSTPCSAAQLALIVDFVGYGAPNFFEGTGPAPAPSPTAAVFRRLGGCRDTNDNSLDFTSAPAAPRNSASPLNNCTATTDPVVTAAPLSAEAMQLDAVTLTAQVTPGTNPPSTFLQVTADLSTVAAGGSASQLLSDNGTGGDAVAGDNVFTALFFLNTSLTPGAYPFGLTVADAEGRSRASTATLTVVPPPVVYLPHDIQGPGPVSPFNTAFVVVEGVVTARKFNGFFLQTTPGFEDADPDTSEGLFVFTSGPAPAAAQVGRLVRAAGTVTEYVPSADPGSPSLTELTFVASVTDLGDGTLPAPRELSAADLSADGPFDQLERFEGMRVSAASLTAVSGTGGNKSEANATSTSDGTFYAVLSGTPRPFREAGIEAPGPVLPCAAAPGPCNIPLFDGNPERLRVDSDALEGVPPADVFAGAVLAGVTGPLDYGFRTYTILPETPVLASGGFAWAPLPQPAPDQFTVASFNMERYFDTVNDPSVGDAVLTPAAYANRRQKASRLIREALGTPDVLAVQEVENLAVLQDLAAAINADAALAGGPSPDYVAYLEEGNDPGGIDVGFLLKTAGGRVSVTSVEQIGRTDTFIDPSDGSVDLLNDRPSLVLRATIQGPSTLPQSLTVINNHLRSLNGANENSATGVRVRAKRQAQAEALAGYIQNRQSLDPAEAIVSVGDYNAFSFNDGYGHSLGTIRGLPAPPDEAVTASADLVDPDLLDLADFIPAADRYSYVFGGNAQTLDHVLATTNLAPQFRALLHSRVNADVPEVLRNDPTTPLRLSDHDPVVAYFAFPADEIAPVIDAAADLTVAATGPGGAVVDYPVPSATDNLDGAVAVTCTPGSGSTFAVGTTTVQCLAADAAGNVSAVSFAVTVTAPPATAGGMGGAGQVGAGAQRAHFAFHVKESAAGHERGWLYVQIRDGGRAYGFVSIRVASVVFSNDPGFSPGRRPTSGNDSVTFSGTGWWHGRPGYTYEATATDRGEPGRGRDTFAVTVRAPGGAVVATVSGTLVSGNNQAVR